MKLEKLATSKFNPFRANVLKDMELILGGTMVVMSSSTGSLGNRYDCSNSTGSLGTSSGDWSGTTWHSGSFPMGYSRSCAEIKTNGNDNATVFLDPKVEGKILSSENETGSNKSRFRF